MSLLRSRDSIFIPEPTKPHKQYSIKRDDLIVVIPVMFVTFAEDSNQLKLTELMERDGVFESKTWSRLLFYARQSILENTTAATEGARVVYYIEDMIAEEYCKYPYINSDDCMFFNGCDVTIPNRNRVSLKTLAPLFDDRLKKYDNVIVIDSDFFVGRSEGSDPMPVDDLSGKGNHLLAFRYTKYFYDRSLFERRLQPQDEHLIDEFQKKYANCCIYSFPAAKDDGYREFISGCLPKYTDDETILGLLEIHQKQDWIMMEDQMDFIQYYQEFIGKKLDNYLVHLTLNFFSYVIPVNMKSKDFFKLTNDIGVNLKYDDE